MLIQGLFEGHLEVQKTPEERLLYFHRIMQMISGVKIGEIVKNVDIAVKSRAQLPTSVVMRTQDDRVHDCTPGSRPMRKKRKRVSSDNPQEGDGTFTEQGIKMPAQNVSRNPTLVTAVELDCDTIEILESDDEESSHEVCIRQQDPQIALKHRSLLLQAGSQGPHEREREIQTGADTFALHSLVYLLKDTSNYFIHGADLTSNHPVIQKRFCSGLPVNLDTFTKLISYWVGLQSAQQNWLRSHVQSKCFVESCALITAIEEAAREAFVHDRLISARSLEIQNRYFDNFPIHIDTFTDLVVDLVADHKRRHECFMVLVKDAVADTI